MSYDTVFSYIITASIYGSTVGIIIYILKSTVLRKLSAKWQFLMWLVMILKLIVPKGPESRISVFNRLGSTIKFTEYELLKFAQKPVQVSSVINGANSVELADILFCIWLAGVIVAFLWLITSFIIFKIKIRASSSAPDNITREIFSQCREKARVRKSITVVVQEHINTTALYGFFKPRILITRDFEAMDKSNMQNTFMHELSHFKRGDIAVNYVLLTLGCIHWFNPVIWFLFKKVRCDAELATDELAMGFLKPDEHKGYGITLINILELKMKRCSGILGIANSKKDIKKRIKAISVYKRASFFQHFCSFLTTLLIACVSLTSSVVAKPLADKIIESIPIAEAPQSYKVQEKPKVADVPQADNEIIKNEEPQVVESEEISTNNDTTDLTAEDNSVQPEKDTVPSETDKVQDEICEYMHFDNMSIDTIIKNTRQVIDYSGSTTDLNANAKIVTYNTNCKEPQMLTVKPNDGGYIQFYVENEGFDHDVYIGVYHIDSAGLGWDYCFNTKTKAPIYLDGYEAGEEYVVTLSCYCPGNYDINGRILVY